MSFQVEQAPNAKCSEAWSYCGIHGQKYPDRRPMGFPFDRRVRLGIGHIENFLTPNMFVKDVVVKFIDTIESPTRNATTSVSKSTVGIFSTEFTPKKETRLRKRPRSLVSG